MRREYSKSEIRAMNAKDGSEARPRSPTLEEAKDRELHGKAYRHKGKWTLYRKKQASGKSLYCFSSSHAPDGEGWKPAASKPAGYDVTETENGVPMLRKAGA